VNENDVNGLANAICDVQKPDVRRILTTAGLDQAKKFSWSQMAETMSAAVIDATLQSLNLRDVNLIIFPDWTQPEEILGMEVEQVVQAIATHPDKCHITLLIDTADISEEDANFFLSGLAMNLLMQADVDVSDGLEISLLTLMSEVQWRALLLRLQARITLAHETQHPALKAVVESLPTCDLDQLVGQRVEQFFFT
ncbi:MAG: glycosyltransferase family 4 protein, partial [Cyanothece sp. SIO1E1]|nr:glycosyltransferase family 4 protein [Cyanothece sp. SIO1E1]